MFCIIKSITQAYLPYFLSKPSDYNISWPDIKKFKFVVMFLLPYLIIMVNCMKIIQGQAYKNNVLNHQVLFLCKTHLHNILTMTVTVSTGDKEHCSQRICFFLHQSTSSETFKVCVSILYRQISGNQSRKLKG